MFLLTLFLHSTTPHLSLPLFFFNATATTEIYTLSLHDALPISALAKPAPVLIMFASAIPTSMNLSGRLFWRSEEHTSELQSHHDLVCRLLLEKKKKTKIPIRIPVVTSTTGSAPDSPSSTCMYSC